MTTTPEHILTGARATYHLFNQDQHWWDARGRRHDIAEMSVRYKTNVIAFLERHAPSHATLYGVGELAAFLDLTDGEPFSREPDPDSPGYPLIDPAFQAASRQRLADPLGWLRSTALLCRLRRDVDNGIGGDDGEREHRAWLARRTPCGSFAPGGHTTFSLDCPYCVEVNSDAPEWTI